MREPLQQILSAALARPGRKTGERPAAAVDFETFYRTEKTAKRLRLSACTVELQGNWGYCRHPEWEAYMVSIYSPACEELGLPEVSFVGAVKDAPWADIAGRVWLSHNRNFDKHVFERCVEQGLVPGITTELDARCAYTQWHDTADLAVFVHLPRALAKVANLAYNLALDKGARTDMDGVQWRELDEDQRERLLAYALEDSVIAWVFWSDYSDRWPEHERALSLHTGNIESRGIPVDRAGVLTDIGILETALWKTRNRIPWVDTEDEDTGKPYALRSKKALNRECLKCGVPPPDSTAAKSADFLDWLDEYGDKVPAIFELARYRRLDRALSVYKALLSRIRPDGRAALGLKYMGADKTGRWSGANKFNLQNLIKVPFFFTAEFEWADAGSRGAKPENAAFVVDIRSRLTASPGRKLLIPDLSQIEPRVLNWVVGNTPFLNLIAKPGPDGKTMSPYEAHARAFMGYAPPAGSPPMKKHAQGLYALAKARVLALGYGAGWAKFIEMARGYCETEAEFLAVFATTPDEAVVERFLDYLSFLVDKMGHKASKDALAAWPELDEQTQHIWVNSWVQVQDFRKTNPLIASKENPDRGTKSGLWERLDKDFKASVNDGVFENELPSGRVLKYFSVTPQWGWSCRPGNPMARPGRTYGGLLTENLVQAIARDVFAHGVLTLEAAGYQVLFHVHDEAIVDCPLDADPAEIMRLLCTVPEWCKSLPVASECEESAHYKK